MRHTFELAAPQVFDLPTLPGVASNGDTTFAVPEWVNIMPMPGDDDRIVSRDYRQLVVDDMAKLVKRSNAALKKQGGGGLVDKDHRTYGMFSNGGAAIGWAEEYELRDDGIYARVMWLPEGREAIASGQYRYTSSVMNGPQEWAFDDDGYPIRLDIFPQEIEGFGITNTPALATLAMFAADEETMDKKIIETALAKLGMSPADVAALSALPVEQLRQRLTSAPATRAMFTDENGGPLGQDLEVDADGNAIVVSDIESDEETPVVDPADVVNATVTPIEPATLSKDARRIAELEAANARLTADAGATFVESLIHGGKLTPAQKPAALAQASTAEGLASLRALYKDAPRLLSNGTAPRQASTPSADKAPPSVSAKAFALAGDKTLSVHEIARRLKETT